jgi:TolB-like protein
MEDEGVGKSSEADGQPPGPAAGGRLRPVFISYASLDAPIAHKVCSALEAAGFPCWIAPRNVVPGTMYADGIVHAIDDSSILVLILSEQAVASAHVGREIERAVSKRHPVVALRIDGAPLTAAFEYFLNQSQWIEGGGGDAAIAQLVAAVGQHLSPGAATSPTNGIQSSVLHRKAPISRRAWVIAAVVVVGLLAGGFLLDRAWRSKPETTASTSVISDKSIAVLPFTDMSEKKDQEYFADGMAEEIIDLLVKVPGLKVISRTSSFQFKGKTEDLRGMATQLGVAYVLEGSVRRSGDRLRVTAQLIDSRDGTHVFSQTYDRDLSDVLKMQDEIAAALVRALQIDLGAAYGHVSRRAPRNTEAYTLYLQGLHAAESLNQQGLEDALSDFQRALELDPSYADAAVGVAAAYFLLGACEKARRAAGDALKLDPKLGLAHAFLGEVNRGCDWDWAAADRELGIARALSPNDVTVLFLSALLSEDMGRWDDGLKFVNASLARDPLNPSGYMNLSITQLVRGRLEEAEAAIRRALEISPTFAFGRYILGRALLARSQPEAALAEMLKVKDEAYRLTGTAMAYFALGRRADSDAALAQMVKNHADHHAGEIAFVFAFRGESDEAFRWLDRAYAQKESNLAGIKSERRILDGDPRYKAFLKKMNLPE